MLEIFLLVMTVVFTFWTCWEFWQYHKEKQDMLILKPSRGRIRALYEAYKVI